MSPEFKWQRRSSSSKSMVHTAYALVAKEQMAIIQLGPSTCLEVWRWPRNRYLQLSRSSDAPDFLKQCDNYEESSCAVWPCICDFVDVLLE